jgi:hypothetical protein
LGGRVRTGDGFFALTASNRIPPASLGTWDAIYREAIMGGFGSLLGFWIFIAAIIVASIWASARKKAEKHETLRRIVEKTGTIDEALLRGLFKEGSSEESKPGAQYRALRIWGTIIMFIGAGLAMFFLIPTLFGARVERGFGGLGISAGIALLGLGVFLSSLFAEPPSGSVNDPPSR